DPRRGAAAARLASLLRRARLREGVLGDRDRYRAAAAASRRAEVRRTEPDPGRRARPGRSRVLPVLLAQAAYPLRRERSRAVGARRRGRPHHDRAACRSLDAAVRIPAAALPRHPPDGPRLPAGGLRLHCGAGRTAAVGARCAAPADRPRGTAAHAPASDNRRMTAGRAELPRILVVAGTRPEMIKLA